MGLAATSLSSPTRRRLGEGLPVPSEVPAVPHVALIQNVCARSVQSLNGAWKTIVDPYENGYYDYRYEVQTEAGYFANRRPENKSELVEFDFEHSEPLVVPGDWNSQRPELFLYEGTIWYQRDLQIQPKPGRRVFVHFGAANYDAKVYLNGKMLGARVGGFTPFDCEIGPHLREHGNFIVVKVDNQRRRDGAPTVNTDWWNYGGLTRDVSLIDVPQTFIRDYFLQLAPGSRNRLRGWVQLDGLQLEQTVSVRIPELGITVTGRTDANGFARLELDAEPTLWSPGHPKRYTVEFAVDTDRVQDRIGFRSIETRGCDLLLNGEPVFLRGISIHEQAPGREGRACTEADARTLLGWAKELDANFVRLAHYPHNEHMVRLADEVGLLVWSEIPVYWTIQWDRPATLANARRQLAEMISRDKNRASVVIWSVGNETPRTDPRLRFMKELTRAARSLDPTRLVSAALERRQIGAHTQMIDDPLGASLDVLGCNEYLGWYDGLPDQPDRVEWTSAYDKPLIISEFGAGARKGHHGDSLTRWSEEYQASVYEHQIRMLDRIPLLRGVSPWILADFRSPRRPSPGIQDFWNRKGLSSERGEKKQAFFVLRDYYERLARSVTLRDAPPPDGG